MRGEDGSLNSLQTEFGTFNFYQYIESSKENLTLIFLSGIGINSSYYDFFNVIEELKSKTTLNLVTLDILGSGLSDKPINKARTLDNITTEINCFLNTLDCRNIVFVCHSFSAVYILNLINSRSYRKKYNVKGFIGIDPTSSHMMLHYASDFDYSLDEVLRIKEKRKEKDYFEIDKTDINPHLEKNLFDECKNCYSNLVGNEFQISELLEAKKTVKTMDNIKLSEEIPSMSILSTLNISDYNNFGNPYFNRNKFSLEIVLNSHHYVHWKQLNLVVDFIINFTKYDLWKVLWPLFQIHLCLHISKGKYRENI